MFQSACRSFNFSLLRSFCTVLDKNASKRLKEKPPINSKGFNDSKYASLKSRFAAIPYESLFNLGIETVERDITDDKNKKIADVVNHTLEVFNYNVKNGKKIRGKALLKAFCTYSFDSEKCKWNAFESDGWKKAVVLAWCLEMLQAHFLMLDDVMDQSMLRRGKPCWYKLPDVGLRAINDSLLLQNAIFKVLQKNFGKTNCYSQILHEFLKVGGHSKQDYDFAEQLCLQIGLHAQRRDDYLDCFGNPELIGKDRNKDIREGKCTWFAVKFLEEASSVEKKQFMENYGQDDEKSFSIIMDLYKNSALLEIFRHFEEQITTEISSLIESMDDIRGGFYYDFLSQIKKVEY